MNLTRLALKRPVSCIMIILALIVFGVGSIFGFKLELTPSIELPFLIVLTTYPGADPQSVNELVTETIEDGVATLSGVDSVISQSSENVSVCAIQYNYGVDINECYDDLRVALERASIDLPADAKTPTIIKMNLNAMPIIRVSCIEKGDIDLANVVEDSIVPEIENVPGVAEVSTTGGRVNYIQVELKPELLRQYGLSMNTLSGVLAAADFTYPAGSLDQGDQEIAITTSEDFNTVELLRNLPLTTGTGQVVRLSEVAEVKDAQEDATSISRYDGEENVQIGVTKNQSYGTVNVANDIKKRLDQIAAENPAIDFHVTYDASDSIISSLTSVGETLVLGVVLSMFVLFLFFGDFKASLIVGSSMPISLLVTLVLMSMAGFSLNVVTMGALVIAIGMMVDNSIVVVESCFRSRDQGYDFRKSAEEGTKEVTLSIIASTITTIVVYVPLATMSGLSGQMFMALGWTIVFAMVASLISAMTLVPLFYSIFKPKEKKGIPVNRLLERFSRHYEPFLHKLLHKKLLVVICTIVVLVVSVFAATTLNVELMPQSDEGVVDVSVSFRSGTNLQAKDRVMRRLEELAEADPEVEHYTVSIGGGSVISSSSTATISLDKFDDSAVPTQDLVEQWYEKTREFTNVDISVAKGGSSRMSGGMGSSADKTVNVEGDDSDLVKTEALRLQAAIRQIPGVTSVASNAQEASTQAKIIVDPLKSMSYGLTPVSVGVTLNNVVSGLEACKVTKEGEEYSVKLEYPKGMYDNLNALLDLDISTPGGVSVPLRDIAEIRYVDAMETLYKEDGKYSIGVNANVMPSIRFEVMAAIDNYVATHTFAEGVSLAAGAQDESMAEELGNLLNAILTAVFLVFLVMAMQFESPKYSGMVMLCIPFALIGSFLFMALVRATVSMVSLMGFLMLMGIVVNNGILFVDTANALRTEMELEEALVKAASIRIRPILMTTLTTILSMVPMAMGFGDNGEMMQGMALVIIGGLIASTLLTLLILPVFYLMLDRMTGFWRKHKEKNVDEEVMY